MNDTFVYLFVTITGFSDDILIKSFDSEQAAINALCTEYYRVLDSDDPGLNRNCATFGHSKDWMMAGITSRYDDLNTVDYRVMKVPLSDLVPDSYRNLLA